MIAEFSLESTINIDPSDYVIYGGLLTYYKVNGSEAKNIRYEETVSLNDLKAIKSIEASEATKKAAKEASFKVGSLQQTIHQAEAAPIEPPEIVGTSVSATFAAASSEVSITGTLPTYKSTVRPGRCSHTAVAIILRWCDTTIASGLVPSSMNTEVKLKQAIEPISALYGVLDPSTGIYDMFCNQQVQCYNKFASLYNTSTLTKLYFWIKPF